jgi:hypothetical protein
MYGTHTYVRFLRDPIALERARTALDRLLVSLRAPGYRPR